MLGLERQHQPVLVAGCFARKLAIVLPGLGGVDIFSDQS
jgi:hypothetical protein